MYKEIEKLYNIKMPILTVENLSKYFLERQINNSNRKKINLFQKLIKEDYQGNIKKYLEDKNKIFNLLVIKIKKSEIENKMINFKFNKQIKTIKSKNNVVNTLKDIEIEKSQKILSYDIKEGNFNAYKYLYENLLSKEEKEKVQKCEISKKILKAKTFKEFFKDILEDENYINKNLIEVLSESKSYRQIIFGNLSPKQNSKILSYITQEIYKKIKNYEHIEIIESQDEKVFITTNYEIIKQILEEENKKIQNILRIEEKYIEIIESIKSIEKNQGKLFYKESVDKKEWKLKGIPKDIYIPMYVKYILNEEIKEKDLYTENDGKIYKLIINYKE